MSSHDADPHPLTHALAELLSREPGMAEHLIRVHVDNGAGLCACCSTDMTRAPWPCSIAWHVARATRGVIKVVVPDLGRMTSGSG